jgi:hypothetical protein
MSLRGNIITVELPSGLPRTVSSRNGKQRDPYCGFMVNVCNCPTFLFALADSCPWHNCVAGSGKSILWYVSHQSCHLFLPESSTSSTIIEECEVICDAGLAQMAYFYFDFRDKAKKDVRGLLTSLLGQLSAKSDACYEILSRLYSRHNAGSRQPVDDALKQCLIDMLQAPGQPATYIIVDALDECPNTLNVLSPRDEVLELVEELINLSLSNLRLCITSRYEADIIPALQPLASHLVSLHDQNGQKEDIAFYVKSVVNSDRRARRWRVEDKELVIHTLIRKAGGMYVVHTAAAQIVYATTQVSMGGVSADHAAPLLSCKHPGSSRRFT